MGKFGPNVKAKALKMAMVITDTFSVQALFLDAED